MGQCLGVRWLYGLINYIVEFAKNRKLVLSGFNQFSLVSSEILKKIL